jgi:hypothetical protein
LVVAKERHVRRGDHAVCVKNVPIRDANVLHFLKQGD